MHAVAVFGSVAITLVALALVARAAARLVATVRVGQPDDRTDDPGRRTTAMLRETVGHTKMLGFTAVGIAHWLVMVGFVMLGSTLVEAYGELFDDDFTLPILGTTTPYVLTIEAITLGTLLGILGLIAIRLANQPGKAGRKSRFLHSTTWQAVYVEITIVGVAVAIFAIRGIRDALGVIDLPDQAYVSRGVASFFDGMSHAALEDVLAFALLFKISISMLWFIVISRNLDMGVAWHRFTAPFNIWFKRQPKALGALRPMAIDFENPGEDDLVGAGAIEHLTWKQLLDTVTCTECGRCQSQCPAWNTGKPLSPKLLIMGLRDHLLAKSPYLLDGPDASAEATAEADRPLVGTYEQGGVIDPDVLWSCTTCGACVEQCPVDIEHVDTIVDMRRYQVLMESSFPSEAGVMLRNLESQGNPWGVSNTVRTEWTQGLPFEVRVFDKALPDDVEWLFWVGCAGAIEDRSKKVTRAVAELLHAAGVSWGVLGTGETCTGDPARRLGNELVYQQLAQTNVATLNAKNVRRIVATCPHCFNTLKNEYPQVGGHYEVVHHTELLARLVEEGRLVPMTPVDAKVTYHDPCYLGRHNEVYTAPREVLESVAGLRPVEMHRCKERGFCCGAGGARMWMEERIGKRINVERTEEALLTGADAVATACPFCMVMLSDAVTEKQQSGQAQGVEVLDVAQILARSLVRPDLAPVIEAAAPVAASDDLEAPLVGTPQMPGIPRGGEL